MQTGGQEASVARKRPAETDAEHLEEEATETAETDSDKRIALKRKAEGDRSDSEMEDSAIDSLAVTDIVGEVLVSKEAADRHRANTTRAQYLSSDRPQIQVECWDLARKMQHPSNLDEMGLKRLARFLGVRSRLVGLLKWQKRATRIESWCDPYHAGCIRTRKSVSGCALMLGNCKGQAAIALSCGEAEYYGLVSATSQMLGLQSVLLDRRWKFKAHV